MTPKIHIPTEAEDAAITAAANSDPDAQPLNDAELRSGVKANIKGHASGYVAGLARATLEAEWAARGARKDDGSGDQNTAAVLEKLAERLRKIAADVAQ